MEGKYSCWCPCCKRHYEDNVPSNQRLGGTAQGLHSDGALIRVCTACLIQQASHSQTEEKEKK
jgi:hypothetical protein